VRAFVSYLYAPFEEERGVKSSRKLDLVEGDILVLSDMLNITTQISSRIRISFYFYLNLI